MENEESFLLVLHLTKLRVIVQKGREREKSLGAKEIVLCLKNFSSTNNAAHSQREKQMLLAMLFSTSKCEKSKAKVEMWPLLKHSYSEVEHVPLLLLLISTSLTKVHTGE